MKLTKIKLKSGVPDLIVGTGFKGNQVIGLSANVGMSFVLSALMPGIKDDLVMMPLIKGISNMLKRTKYLNVQTVKLEARRMKGVIT